MQNKTDVPQMFYDFITNLTTKLLVYGRSLPANVVPTSLTSTNLSNSYNFLSFSLDFL